MNQSIKCLLCKHEDLTVTPRRHVQKYWMWWYMLGIPALGWLKQADFQGLVVN